MSHLIFNFSITSLCYQGHGSVEKETKVKLLSADNRLILNPNMISGGKVVPIEQSLKIQTEPGQVPSYGKYPV